MSESKNRFKRLDPKCDWLTLSAATKQSSREELMVIAEKILSFFKPLEFEGRFTKHELTFKSEGIFLRLIKNSVTLQLQGYLFTTREDFFKESKVIAKNLSAILYNEGLQLNPLMHISRLDICQDFIGPDATPDLFREFMDEKYENPLNCSYINYITLKNRARIDTGFLLKNKNWELGCYNKKEENLNQQNKEKQLFILEKYNTLDPVTRLELRLLSSDKNILATQLFYDPNVSEDTFFKKVLADWYRSHMIRIPNRNDKKISRWPKHTFFRSLFVLDNSQSIQKTSDIIGCPKSLIQFNTEIAKRTLQSSMNNVVDILDRLKSKADYEAAIERAKETSNERKILRERKKVESESFFKRIEQLDKKAA